MNLQFWRQQNIQTYQLQEEGRLGKIRDGGMRM